MFDARQPDFRLPEQRLADVIGFVLRWSDRPRQYRVGRFPLALAESSR